MITQNQENLVRSAISCLTLCYAQIQNNPLPNCTILGQSKLL